MEVNIFKNKNWSLKSSGLIIKYIKKLKLKKINIILTGGKSASKIYSFFFLSLSKLNKNFSTYLTDERCVNYNNINSNFYLIINKLKSLKYSNLAIFPILNKKKSYIDSAIEYQKKIPYRIDLLLLSVGKDGHIASIFENNKVALNTKKKVVFI